MNAAKPDLRGTEQHRTQTLCDRWREIQAQVSSMFDNLLNKVTKNIHKGGEQELKQKLKLELDSGI